jgi:sugar/nucleoside kinase (ribokinase family)
MIGADTFGALTRDQLGAAGIGTAELRTDPDRPTGLSVILTHGDTRTTLTLVGAIASLDPEGIGADLLGRARHVHASSFFLQPRLADGLAGLFRRAHQVGTTTSLDTNLDPADRWDGLADVLPVTDVMLPNRTEILGLAGRYAEAGSSGSDVVAAAGAIAQLGPLVVVKDGERGAFAVGPDGSVQHEAGHPVAAVDSTGAGDSFDAGFLAARLSGLPLARCLGAACRAGALSTLGIGGTSTQASAAQLELGAAVPIR